MSVHTQMAIREYRSRVPSAEHESPIALVKLDTDLPAMLLADLFGIGLPSYDYGEAYPTEVQILVPHSYHADGITVYRDSVGTALLTVILEVQRSWDADKRFTWKLYVAQLGVELKVTTVLLVYCPNRALARRYRDMFAAEQLGLLLRPLIFTPDDLPLIFDVERARTHPGLAVLAAICHSDHPDIDAAFPALVAALRELGPEQASLYYEVVVAGLPMAPRTRWEVYMSTTVDVEFRSQLLAANFAQGKAQGEAEAVVKLLRGRGVHITPEVEAQIMACTDPAQLDDWLLRAATATSGDELIA